ncbi:MAG: hypothetical protein HQK83_08110 [Fibrobacteria bacterium]|nr:hypothetical protein [Fibrobacteria bacterium]
MKFLSDFITTCKNNNITLICFCSPLFSPTPKQFINIDKMLYDFFKEKNVPFLDYSRNVIQGLEDPWLWKDGSHMNESGAKFFTKMLLEDLIKISGKSE